MCRPESFDGLQPDDAHIESISAGQLTDRQLYGAHLLVAMRHQGKHLLHFFVQLFLHKESSIVFFVRAGVLSHSGFKRVKPLGLIGICA
jgi:hypothetical protein